MKKIVIFTLGILMGVNAFAQTPAARPMTAPAPAMDVQLSNTLAQLEQAAQDTHAALGKMRVDKWKTDSSVKKQYQGNVESLQRNLSAALPELTGRVRQAPQDSNANFKLYRNVNTLYDVLANVVETAGAFGPKDQYEALAQQVGMLDQIRRTLGDRLDQLALGVRRAIAGGGCDGGDPWDARCGRGGGSGGIRFDIAAHGTSLTPICRPCAPGRVPMNYAQAGSEPATVPWSARELEELT